MCHRIEHLSLNMAMQLLVGVPLEMVHGALRIGLIYVCGVLAGGQRVISPLALHPSGTKHTFLFCRYSVCLFHVFMHLAAHQNQHTCGSVSVCGASKTDGFVSLSSQQMRKDVGGCQCLIKSPPPLIFIYNGTKQRDTSNKVQSEEHTIRAYENKHGACMTGIMTVRRGEF